mgnify:CR=1 FL=1
MKNYSYEDCRDIVRGWGLEKLATLITRHRKAVEQMKIVGANEVQIAIQENFILAMEHELDDQLDLIEAAEFDLNLDGGMSA